MAFSNLFFLLIFLPVSLVLYLVVPKVAKNAVLVLLGLVFFAWGRPEYVILLLLSSAFTYLSGRQIVRHQGQERPELARLTLISAVAFDLLVLGFYKYGDFLVENLNSLFRLELAPLNLPLPLGISFYTFSLLSYLFDVYRQKAPALANPIDFGVYVTFFPKLVSGPIVKYEDMVEQIRQRSVSFAGIGSGSRRFLIGLSKKVLLSNTIGVTFNAVFAQPAESLTVAGAWLGALCYSLMLYFDFSGYSDMAIGLAEMFGFRFAPNFNYPYTANSVSDFWRRWHMSLNVWFRDYVYIPLGGSRVSKPKIIRNLLVVWALTGIWHGASWNFVVWGLYYGLLLIAEKFVLKPVLDKLPGLLRHLLTLLAVVIGWVFFFTESMEQAFAWLGRMFFSGPMTDSLTAYLFSGCWPLLVIGIVACTPLCTGLGRRIYRSRYRLRVMAVSAVFFMVLLLLCIAGMTNDTYSSFLYFQF